MVSTVHDVIEQVEQLSPSDQKVLFHYLQAKFPDKPSGPVTREQLLAEHEQLKASGAFDNVESLLGKYAKPELEDISFEEIEEYLLQVGREWEEEIDEFFGDE